MGKDCCQPICSSSALTPALALALPQLPPPTPTTVCVSAPSLSFTFNQTIIKIRLPPPPMKNQIYIYKKSFNFYFTTSNKHDMRYLFRLMFYSDNESKLLRFFAKFMLLREFFNLNEQQAKYTDKRTRKGRRKTV